MAAPFSFVLRLGMAIYLRSTSTFTRGASAETDNPPWSLPGAIVTLMASGPGPEPTFVIVTTAVSGDRLYHAPVTASTTTPIRPSRISPISTPPLISCLIANVAPPHEVAVGVLASGVPAAREVLRLSAPRRSPPG